MEKETNKKLSKSNTRLFKDNLVLYYHSLNYLCSASGIYKPRGDNVRQPKTSKKCGCPFNIRLVLNDDKTKLRISPKSVFQHNTVCGGMR